jgi:uncharacterized protein
VLEELRALGPVEAVHGNGDDVALLAELPAERLVEVGGARIAIVHDAGPRTGRHERLRRRFPGSDAVVYGHSHVPEVGRAEETWILNPGSPTERRRAPERTMIVLTVEEGGLRPRLLELPAA